ncbi:MAG: ABC transporter permease, partial [Verrucomicrobiota bacterium]
LGGYFASLTGYVLIAVTLLLLGLSFMDMLVKLNAEPTDAPVTEVFYATYYFWLILLLTAPVMTMRLFALEKFSGTYETLMTAPVRDLQVVLAKFSAALFFYVITWLPLLGCIFLVNRFSNDPSAVDVKTMGSMFLGIVLIGSVFMSLGTFASALTRNQIIAAMLSYGLSLALFMLSLRSLVATAAPEGWARDFFGYISLLQHMEQFARGVIDTRPIVFCLSLTIVCLYLTLKVVESRRWK